MKVGGVVVVLGLAIVASGCSGSPDSSQDSTSPAASPSRTTPPQEPTPTREPAVADETAAQDAARELCARGGELLPAGLNTFIANGPGPAATAPIETWMVELDEAETTFAADDAAAAADGVVDLLVRQAQGLLVLYGEGETAYQVPKANGMDVDALNAEIAEAWPEAMDPLFSSNAPTAPLHLSLDESDCY